MANRYWVGGAGTWDTTNTANWAATSGGAGGATVPVAGDAVWFDANSGTGTVTAVGTLEMTDLRFSSPSITFDAGTSQLNLVALASVLVGGDQTFYNVAFTFIGGGSLLSGCSIYGNNTFNNLTLSRPTTVGSTRVLQLHGDQTVLGKLECPSAYSSQRAYIRSATLDVARTLTVASMGAGMNFCDFRDITIAGAASPFSPSNGGDCGGNSGIIFPVPRTLYRIGTNATFGNTYSWSLTSGGANTETVPLAQDTAIIDNNTALTGTLKWSAMNIGTLDCSSRTTAITIGSSTVPHIYGSFKLGTGVSTTGTSVITFSGSGTMLFDAAGKTTTFPVTVNTPTGTLQLVSDYVSTNALTLTRGTFDAASYNVTCTTFASNSTNTRTLNMGSGLWTLSGAGSLWNLGVTTGLTLNKGTSGILLSNTTTTGRVFDTGGFSYNKLTIGGAAGVSVLTFTGSGSFTELTATKAVAHTITLADGLGIIGTWSVTGTAGNVVTVNSAPAGARRNFTLTNSTAGTGIDYLNVKDIGELSGDKFYVGANSTDGGNNSNVYFTGGPSLPSNGLFFGSNF